MKKARWIVFLSILGSQLAAQNVSTFNKIYTVVPGMFCVGQRVILSQNGYMIYGTTDSNNLSRISVTKIDTLGNLVWNKSYGKAGYNYVFGNVPGGGDGVSVPWGGYIESGYITNNTGAWYKSALYRFDDKGDTLWTKIYNDSINELGITVKLTRQKKYIVGGMWEINDFRFFTTTLKETDTLGNTIWQKTYQGLPSHLRESVGLDTCKDGGYIICANDVDTNYAYGCASSIFIMKTDSVGIPQWTQYINAPICGLSPAYIISLRDGSYLIGGGYTNYITNGGYEKFNKLYLAKISPTGTIKWTKQCGAGSWGGSLIFSLKELKNGDIIACGGDSISNGFSSPISCNLGCILKVDSNGNQKWIRYYEMQSPAEQDNLYDIQPTPDGGYVATGQTYPGVGGATQNIWVVKTDSLGCDTVGCNYATGVSEVKGESEMVKVYPNPSNGQFTLSLSYPELVSGTQTIEIYNVLGARVYHAMLKQVQHDYTIHLSSQPNGVYMYRVIAESGKLIGEGKVVIE